MQLFAGRLVIGLAGPLHVRHERLSARPDACRLMYVSDLHLRRGRSKTLSQQVIRAVRANETHAVLLGGDLLDSASELENLAGFVRELTENGPVLAIGGNHDRAVGIGRVRKAVEDGGGVWIHETAYRLPHDSRLIAVTGPEAVTTADGDVRILCGHHPRIWKGARHDGYDLVLAGHLHGCQLVAFEFRDRLLPGALFYPCCYRSHQPDQTRLVVSRGVSDLIPIRWRCPREVVLCHV